MQYKRYLGDGVNTKRLKYMHILRVKNTINETTRIEEN